MTRAVVALVALLIASPVIGAPAPRVKTADIDLLIQSLAEPDPAARQAAADRLIALGADARPALLDALESDNPAIRSRAGELLQELPWFREDDPEKVKEILARYGSMDDGQRLRAAGQLATLEDHLGHDALLRLATEEPSERVRWTIVAILREISTYGPAKARLQQLDEKSTQPAIVLLAGWGWWNVDTGRSHGLFQKAVDLESQNWRQPNAAMATALNVLIEDATVKREYDRAADLIRQKIPFLENDNSPAADPHLELLALHAEHGPLTGFAKDLRELAGEGNRREVLYAGARMLERWLCYPGSQALASAAIGLAPKSREDYEEVADFLAAQRWYRWAKAEYLAAMEMDDPKVEEPIADAEIMFRLSHIATQQEQHAEAADYLEEAMKLVAQTEDMLLQRRGQPGGSIADNTIWAEIHFRRYLAARENNDKAAVAKHLNELLTLQPTDIDIAIEIVPVLKEAGRAEDAQRLFDAAYAALKQYCDEEPENPEHMNNLAWLCARSGERLEEALKLATDAITVAPENYAYLDTAAEAYFRTGNAAKAVELEEKALNLHPHDSFMMEQLERFRVGIR